MPLLAAALVAAAPARAQVAPAGDAPAHHDTLSLTGQLDQLSPGEGGGGAALDWTRRFADSNVLHAGFASYSLADSRWRFVRAGGAVRGAQALSVFGQASLGSGHNANGDFPYRILSLGLHYKATQHLHLKFDDQYFDVDTTHGHLPRGALIWLPDRNTSVDAAYARSAGGNLASHHRSLRVDRSIASMRLFAGVAFGRTRPEIINVGVGATGNVATSREAFVGGALPIGRRELTAVVNRLDVGDLRRTSLTLVLKFPLGG